MIGANPPISEPSVRESDANENATVAMFVRWSSRPYSMMNGMVMVNRIAMPAPNTPESTTMTGAHVLSASPIPLTP